MDSDKQQDLSNVDQVNTIQPVYNIDQQPTFSNDPQPMPSFTTTTVQVGPMTNLPAFSRPVGPKSMEMICLNCRCRIKTSVRHRSTCKTHIACLLLTGCCCCCLPYCMDSCRNTNHFCPMCGTFLGTYSS